jgi:hypothetical protein
MNAREALLTGLIDYAGLFPPAGLSMQQALRNYASYRQSEHAWMLGSFILPWQRCAEFEQSVRGEWTGAPWQLSVLAGKEAFPSREGIAAIEKSVPHAKVAAIEFKLDVPADFDSIAHELPPQCAVYVEIPVTAPAPARDAWLHTLKRHKARAKIRTGGVTPEAIPPAPAIAAFLVACARAGVAFKATAGLHHPVAAEHRLTYESGSSTAWMQGFLNVFVAASVAYAGAMQSEVLAVLEERREQAFRIEEGGVTCGTFRCRVDQLCSARREFAVSFGSCSFDEPIHDLRRMGWL